MGTLKIVRGQTYHRDTDGKPSTVSSFSKDGNSALRKYSKRAGFYSGEYFAGVGFLPEQEFCRDSFPECNLNCLNHVPTTELLSYKNKLTV